MRQSSIPVQRGPIEVQLFGDGLRGAGRRLVAGGKCGPAFYPCPDYDGAGTALVKVRGIDGAPDQLATVHCQGCNPAGGAR